MEGHEVYIPIQTDPTAVANRFTQEISLQRAVALPLAEDTTLTAEARTEAQERFDTAQARLTELATSTITNFQNQRERVGEVLANRRASVRGGEGVFNPQTDVSPVSKSVTELLTAVRENLLPVDFMAGVDPDVRDFALRTLKAMSDKYQLYGLDTYSPEVWGMIDRLTKGDVEIASLKEQFDEFKASHVRRRPEVVKEYSDLLLDSLSEVPQHARELFVSEDENPQDMEYIADDMLDPTPPPIEEKKDPRRREGQVEVVSLNDIEKEKFGELTKKITGALDDNYAGRDDKAEGDTIGYDEWNDLSSYVRFGTPLSTINPERLAIVLNKLGVSGVEFNEFNALGQRYFAKMQEEGQGVRTMYVQDKGLIESLGQAQVSFSVESFVREYLDVGENGVEQMQLTPQKRAQFKDMIEGYVFEAVKNVDPTLSWEDAFGPQEQEYTRTIRGYLNGIAQSKELAVKLGGTTTESYREVKQFLDSQLGYVNTLTNMYQIFHNLPQSAHDGSIFEKWPQFMTRIMSSEFAEVLRGDLVQIAIDTHAQHIHNRIIQNNNVVPSDLFAGELKTKLGERRNEDFDAIQRQILERAKSMEHINPMLKGMTEGQAKRAMIIAHGLSFVDLRFFEHLSMANPMKAGDFKASPYNALVSHLDYRKGWGGLRGGVDNTKDVPILYKMMYQRFVPYSLGKFGTHDWKPGAFYKDPEGYTLEEMRRHNDFFVDFVLNSYESDAIFNIDGLLTRIGWRFDLIEKEYVKPWIEDVGELYDSCKTEAAKNANQGVPDLKEQAAMLRRYVAMDVDDQTLCRYFEGVRKGMDKGSKEGWTPEHWRMYNQLYANQLGTISGWVTSSSRAGSEMDVLLKAGLGIDVVDNTRNGVLVEKEELEHLKKAYHVGVELNTRKMQHEKVIHLNYLGADGRFHSRADTYAVAERIKKTQHRAEYFEQTFARNPAALYMELGSVLPEMLDFSDVEKHDEWLWKAPVAKIHEYEVKAARHELTKDDEKKWELLKKAKEIRIRWGWDGGAQDHGAFDKLAILRDRLQMIVADDGPLAFVEGGRAKRLNYFFEEMGIATQRSGETERYVVGEKIVQSKDENGNVVEVKQNIFKDVKARRAAMRRDDIRKKNR
jgi:hypothetical protein